MTTEIYADTLFAVNFSMDFLALFITGKTLHAAIRPLKLTAAALLGAVFATAMAVFDKNVLIIKIIWWLAFVSCAASMCAVAFGGGVIRQVPVFIAVNLGLGGVMSALYGLARRSGLTYPAADSGDASPLMFAAFALISGAVSLIYSRIRSGRAKREAEAAVELFGQSRKLRLIVDSGNLLREPISGRPAIVTSANKLGDLLPPEIAGITADGCSGMDSLPVGIARSIRLLPAQSVNGSGLLIGIIPDRVSIDGRSVEAVIALGEDRFGDCDGILPEILIL